MSLYRVRTDGSVKTQGEIRRDNPNTSLPAVWTKDVCDAIGVDPVLNGAQPTPTFYQIVAQQGVEQINGQWFTKFVCVDMSQEAKDDKDAECKAGNKATAEKLLSETDWTQVADVPLLNKQAFADYRAAVRAIALNPPVIVDQWATKPAEQWS